MNLYIKNKNRFLLCLLFFVTSTCSFAQKDNLLSVKQMHKDLRYFYETILKVHPNPYQVLPPEQLDIKVQELLQSIDKPLNRLDFFLKIGVLNSCFDYHTQIDGNIEYWKVYSNFFPPDFINWKDSIFCFVDNHPYLDSTLWGAKINTINHISCKELTSLAKLYVSFEDYHCLPFDANIFLMQHLLNKIQDTIELEYEIANKKGVIKFDLKDAKNLWQLAKSNSQKNELLFNCIIFKDDAIALLELNSFLEEAIDTLQYFKFLDHFFDSINSIGIQHLFIDISANGGGDDWYGYVALEYLIKDSTYYLGKLLFKTSTERKKMLRKYDKDMYHDYQKEAKNKRFFASEAVWEKKSPDNANPYKNNVYLIQSWQTASAASDIVMFIKAYKTGITIGTEISDEIAFYGNIVPFEMKHSKLQFTCATSYYVGVGAENNAAKGRIQPDVYYPIINPAKSFTLGQLKEMLQLIEQYKKETR